MVTPADIGRRVVIVAADDYYAAIDGCIGTIDGFVHGHAAVHVPNEEVDIGYLRFLVPPEQLALTV